jgi:hypothetical protein
VDLRQHDKAERVGDPNDPIEERIDLGLHHEATCAGPLDDVADRVETDDPDPMGREGP